MTNESASILQHIGANFSGIVLAQADTAVSDLNQHGAAVLNHAYPGAGDYAQFLKAVRKRTIAVNAGDNAFFARLPATKPIRTHSLAPSSKRIENHSQT